LRVSFQPRDAPTARRLAEVLEVVQRVGMAGELHDGIPAGAETVPPSLSALGIVLPAGLAFGSGFHPATIATLHLLARHTRAGATALDLGCGSGILSVALARLGAASVLALDNDPVSVQATRRAVEHNDVTSVEVRLGSLGRGGQLGHWMGWTELGPVEPTAPAHQFDLIAANIMSRVHAELAVEYAAALAPNGMVVTAGYMTDAAEDVSFALRQAGLEQRDGFELSDYVALAHIRPG